MNPIRDGERDDPLEPRGGVLRDQNARSSSHLANRPHGRYALSAPISFSHRGDEVAAQAATGALRYDITFHPDKGRWYLDASWKATPAYPPSLAVLRSARILAVDLNADHLAAWVLNPDGNPVGPAITIAIELARQSSTTRDGRLRAAIAGLCHIAKANGCQSLALENLDFKDARDRGREARGRRPARGRRGRAFRALLAGISTAKFKDRVTQMAHNASLAVIAVDPAYTTKWGAQHWLAPLDTEFSAKVSGHHAGGGDHRETCARPASTAQGQV